jgi:hypothetical protein
LILGELRLMRFQVLEVGEVGEVEEARESHVVPVTVGYIYEQAWAIRRRAPRLARVNLRSVIP